VGSYRGENSNDSVDLETGKKVKREKGRGVHPCRGSISLGEDDKGEKPEISKEGAGERTEKVLGT